MNILPTIYGTIANWPLTSDLRDTSGHGLDLITVDWTTALTPGGVEQYGALDSCINGFKFNGATKLVAPLSTLLQLTGPYTVQFLLKQNTGLGGPQCYACCVDPAGRSGGPAADRAGSLFTWFWSTGGPGTMPYFVDRTQGGAANLFFAPAVNPFVPPTAWGIGEVHSFALRDNGDHTRDIFYDGVKRPGVSGGSANTATGVERFYVGSDEVTNADVQQVNSIIASYRVVNYARTDAQLLADANFMTSATCSLSPSPPVTDATNAPLTTATGGIGLVGPAVTAELYRYAPAAYGDKFRNPGQ